MPPSSLLIATTPLNEYSEIEIDSVICGRRRREGERGRVSRLRGREREREEADIWMVHWVDCTNGKGSDDKGDRSVIW
jgi:hypothetical protein